MGNSKRKPPKAVKLTQKAGKANNDPRRAKFFDEYARTHNGTQSALAAGYSKGSAGSTASRLLKEANYSGKIDEAIVETIERKQITVAGLLENLADLAYLPFPAIAKTADIAAIANVRIKAISVLLPYAEKSEGNNLLNKAMNMAGISDEKLEQIA